MGNYTGIKSSRTKTERDIKLGEKSEVFNWESLKFPVSLSDINKSQNRNSSISVNVYGYEKYIYPLRISEHNYKRESTVNLLLISDDTKQSYCCIKNTGKLIYLQTSTYGHVRHVCFRCVNTFNSEILLASNHECCKSYEAIKIELPEEGSNIYFKNHNMSMRVPFIVYADFESITSQLSTCQLNPEKSYTKQYRKHIPSGLSYRIKCFDATTHSQEPVTFVK